MRHVAPFLPFAEGDHLHQMVRKYMSLAHLPSLKKRCGMHSLRHTAASRLLESGVSLDTISNILGHEDPDSTFVYLKTDVERLRQCCLAIPEGAP
ncbi:MAG: tyrosine-type recombinase/integrase [Clostridia bacterium]|nr:tyrosine-type recombinase/integrase [Clostridia bacterium]